MRIEGTSTSTDEVGRTENCFLGLLLEEQLLQAEFEAMIAEEFPKATQLSARRPLLSARTFSRGGASGPTSCSLVAAPETGSRNMPGRQRSPPRSVAPQNIG